MYLKDILYIYIYIHIPLLGTASVPKLFWVVEKLLAFGLGAPSALELAFQRVGAQECRTGPPEVVFVLVVPPGQRVDPKSFNCGEVELGPSPLRVHRTSIVMAEITLICRLGPYKGSVEAFPDSFQR